IGSFLSTPLRETSGTALTEPRAHSRIHCIARSVAFSLLAANRTFLLINHCAVIGVAWMA
ncbi:TPA: hypothetical protein ACXL4H_005873, partial [Klebsiella pneumoniae]